MGYNIFTAEWMDDTRSRLIVTGGTGFIGRALVRELSRAGYDLVILTRALVDGPSNGIQYRRWDGRTSAGWAESASGARGIINLAGENIAAGRWTKKRRRAILESRLAAGEAVVEAVEKAAVKPGVVIQASAIGFYGNRREGPCDETAAAGEGFLAEVVQAWERSTRAVEDYGVRRIVMRSGLVLGPGDGVFPRLLLPFRFFAGGPLSNGRQGFSWIHLRDEIRAIRLLLEKPDAAGVYNLSAPQPVPQKEFARRLGRILGRPSWLPVPAFLLLTVYGAMARETLLADQIANPARLLREGFKFDFPDVESALLDLTGKRRREGHR